MKSRNLLEIWAYGRILLVWLQEGRLSKIDIGITEASAQSQRTNHLARILEKALKLEVDLETRRKIALIRLIVSRMTQKMKMKLQP